MLLGRKLSLFGMLCCFLKCVLIQKTTLLGEAYCEIKLDWELFSPAINTTVKGHSEELSPSAKEELKSNYQMG
jgi:hypothetical protein